MFVFREVKESTQVLYCNMAERKFDREEKDKYSLSEKYELRKFCAKYKEEYDKKINENKSTVNFNERRKKTQRNYQEKDILLEQFESITKT